MQKFVPRSRVELFATNAPDPTHWNLNVLVHFVLFVCIRDRLTKLGAKRADVVQKFVPRSRVGIFCNERIRSTPLHLKLTFSCVLYYLGAFGTIWLPYETRCKMGRTSAKSSCPDIALEFFAKNSSDPPHRTVN